MNASHSAQSRTTARPAVRHSEGRRRKLSQSGPAGVTDPTHGFSGEEWHDMVSTAAYHRAEARGFENGSADEDWYEAEAELRERFCAADSDVEAEPASGGTATDIETKGE